MVYVAVDCYFDQQTETKVKNWNSVIKDEDEILILGHFCDKDFATFLKRLKGKKCVIDRQTNSLYSDLTKDQLIEKGFSRVGQSFGYIVNPKTEQIVHILPDIEIVNRFKAGHLMFGASARTITKQKKLLENNILSLSYQDWDNTPIEYEEIPNLIENIKNLEGDFIDGKEMESNG